jgi:multiple sugar transport system ATP-binding protein
MTVRENIGFGLKMTTDLSTAAVDRQVEETASMLDITELLDSKPKALSGGQRQRVALGRAIVRDPEVFLLDEPLSNLDATLRSRMRTEIQQLQRELGVTTLYVTHDQTEAMTMSDLIAVMRDGRLQQLGTPLECYHEPANEFVAGFIGEPSMNFFEFRYCDGRLIGDALEYAPTERMTEALAASGSRTVTMGIRPEDVDVVEDASPDGRSFQGTVEVVEPVGERTLLYTDLSGLNLTVAVGGDVRVTEGATLDLRLPPDRVHLFGQESGAAVLHARCDGADASVPGAEHGDG